MTKVTKIIATSFLLFSAIMYGCGESAPPPENRKVEKQQVADEDSVSILDGIYQSSDSSFQKNFYLVISGKKATMYGWSVAMGPDTLFYRSETEWDINETDTYILRFEQFDLAESLTTRENMEYFIARARLEREEAFSLHTHFTGELKAGKLILLGTKDIYDSRADEFVFEKMK